MPDKPYLQGNIDLYHRPKVLNPDGSISTVRSMSFRQDGKEVLVPTVIPDGNGGFVVDESGDAAWRHYQQTGEHLGKFANVGDADKYAEELHNGYANGVYDTPGKPILSAAGATMEMLPAHVDLQALMRAFIASKFKRP